MFTADTRSQFSMFNVATKHTNQRGLRAFAQLTTFAALAAAAVPASAAAQPAESAPASARISCQTVPVQSIHGGRIPDMSHLSRIVNGRVLSLNANTGAKRMIRFTNRSGRWLRSTTGARYAMAGQSLTPAGRPGGAYLIAAKLGKGRRTPCARATDMRVRAADSAGVMSGTTLPSSGCEEVSASEQNTCGLLKNWSTQIVCAGTRTHPDGARYVSNPMTGVWCYQGVGAWLNDPNGMERREPYPYTTTGEYYDTPEYRHWIVYNNGLVPAAKRPASKPDGTAVLTSRIVWRTYSPNFHYPAGFDPCQGGCQ